MLAAYLSFELRVSKIITILRSVYVEKL